MESVPEARPVAVYDANVLYPAHLRDLLMRLAVGDLVRAHWSDQIHEEWMRNVCADYADVTWEDLEYTRSEMDWAPERVLEVAGSKRRPTGWKTAARSFEERQFRNTLGRPRSTANLRLIRALENLFFGG